MGFYQIHTYKKLTYHAVFTLKKYYFYNYTIKNSDLYVKEILAIEDEACR